MSIKTKRSVKILPVVAPINIGQRGGRLNYNRSTIRAQKRNVGLEPALWKQLLRSAPGSQEELHAQKSLSEIFLGSESVALISSLDSVSRKRARSKFFTEQSIKLYGTQDVIQTLTVMLQDLEQFKHNPLCDARDVKKLEMYYKNLGVDSHTARKSKNREAASYKQMFKEINVLVDPIRSVINNEKMYTSREISKTILPECLRILGAQDKRWKIWKIKTSSYGSIYVNSDELTIIVGRNRAPAIGSELLATLAHELFVHALRSANSKTLGLGELADSTTFEEGLGCFFEYAIKGYAPDKIAQRQITASMALGQFKGGRQYDRNEIYKILSLRTKLMLQSRGVHDDQVYDAKLHELQSLVIDRFFRGSPGIRPYTAVFTRDTMYARGFVSVCEFISDKMRKGHSAEHVLYYLVGAKFDPTNDAHATYAAANGLILT